ncbi:MULTISPECIES: FliM/FliN family flagellar motor switch protein [unclassified Pseudomonas]|uniref:FliM/FliN family flagellar motor switch protein n=1 Tax=unclassified Pseudomonas TaxID=196821 RepID=UPI000C86C1D0|nr:MULTISPECIES: FliM/FliN family flagellar motor switch protein [unclassified Pseudomonas]PMV26775.1 YscQ/HrcQ family type III secretion apparatus protein [Pseudomonas sp. FW305-3-2-15-C-TSA2]PMV32146.1 YscQ/HrcQ family type III secretion apparatus protein [Pseudomonas sp. DP16D-L5]PMV41057.1 YscQ/HrcQ family type III secretion apparatus protein [Pseudomonas sp. FW305-3-2-15-A-LB2]PMV48314.1 YscQ/HrcQ family type III secretion apparatus protein [Pseudomonas sp. FW305-3-2-15-C-R2A1]PMV54771.1 
MIVPLLTLPSINGDIAAARRRLGRGMSLVFHVAGQAGQMLLEPGRAPAGGQAMFFETACGVLALAEAGPLLSLLGECPVTLAPSGNDPDSWFWALFQFYLSPQVKAVLGYVRLLETEQLPKAFGCRLSVALGNARVEGYVWLAPESFLVLCDAGPWRATARPMPASFRLTIAVTLGRLQLPIAQVRSLRTGDVLVLEQSFFVAEGSGYLQVGTQRLYGRIDDDSGPLGLTLTSIEETSVDEEYLAPDYAGDEGDEPVMDVFGHEPFDELSMALNVRCGTLNLTLGELRNLAPGAVLGIAGYAPGMAGLYYGDRPIGQGQLVEVDGRLGLQLSRVMFGR